MTLFIVTTLDEWPALADPLRASDLHLNYTVWIFFAFTVLATGTVVANLFIAVVTLAFARARENESAGGIYNFALNIMDFALNMMDFALNMMDFALNMMDFALNMMDFA